MNAKKLAGRVADEEAAKAERLREEIAAMFARRSAARWCWHDKWGRDGWGYAEESGRTFAVRGGR